MEGLFYLCCENNSGADQLSSYRAAGLQLCFCKCKKAGFLMTWVTWLSYITRHLRNIHFTKSLEKKLYKYRKILQLKKKRIDRKAYDCHQDTVRVYY